MTDFQEVQDHVPPSKFPELEELLEREKPLSRIRFSQRLKRVAKKGHDKALENYLFALRFVEPGPGGVHINVRAWRTYRNKALGKRTNARSTFRPLVNVPAVTNIPVPTGLVGVQAAVDELLREPASPCYILAPFLDGPGAQELARIMSTLNSKECHVVLVTRFTPDSSPSNEALRVLLSKLEESPRVEVANFHHQEANKKYVKWSFHAKGVYLPDACVLATMNYVDANMARNIEFGVLIRGQAAAAYHHVARDMTEGVGRMSVSEALKVLP